MGPLVLVPLLAMPLRAVVRLRLLRLSSLSSLLLVALSLLRVSTRVGVVRLLLLLLLLLRSSSLVAVDMGLAIGGSCSAAVEHGVAGRLRGASLRARKACARRDAPLRRRPNRSPAQQARDQ
jgi:hypothetical protein